MSSENESQPSLHSRTIDAGTQRATVQESTSQGKAPEQLRACESCRQRKIRCPGPSGTDDGPCEKCRSSGRSCQTRQRANRVRRKRVEVRVRELEQRILSLAANLENSSTANNGSIDVIPCSVPDASSEAFNECLTGSGNAHKIASSQRSAPVVRNRLKPTADGRILSLPTKRSRLWRKPFERSAGGCKPCKQRKVKCDETKPHCKRCARDQQDCRYPTPLSSDHELPLSQLERIQHLRFEQFTSSLLTMSSVLGLDTAQIDHRVSGVLTHWDRHTIKSFGAPHMQAAMGKWGFDLASRAPYLLHALTAFSVLHLQHVRGVTDPGLIDLYDHHFHSGIELYGNELSNTITSDNIDAIFAACMLFAFMAYCTGPATPSSPQETPPSFFSSDFVWLMSQCGFLMLKQTTQNYLSRSVWHELFAESDYQASLLSERLDISIIPPEWRLLCGINESGTNSTNPYYRALHMLLLIQAIDGTNPENFSHFMAFPGRMRPEFLELVQGRDEVALLLLAHWLAKMSEMDQWWCEARVKSECWAICDYLSSRSAGLGSEQPNVLIEALLQTPMRACGYLATPTRELTDEEA